ncbi:MAG: response regulator [Candidatus Omnitrophota bacterium]
MTKTHGPVSVLVAEDDDEYFELLKELMDEAGFGPRVQRFANGEELMTFLSARGRNQAATVIMMDLNMPRKTGYEALKEIRANPDLRRIPVVMMTVSSDPMDIARCYESGANSYITKPFDFTQLLETLKVFRQYWIEKVTLPV